MFLPCGLRVGELEAKECRYFYSDGTLQFADTITGLVTEIMAIIHAPVCGVHVYERVWRCGTIRAA